MAERVLGVLAGNDVSDAQLSSWAQTATHLYAADSAADRLLKMGFEPVVVGDLDSVDKSLFNPNLRIVHDADPDHTDCDKLLNLILADGFTTATIIGIEGDLFDHLLASMSSLAASPLRLRLALRRGLGHILRGGDQITVPDAFGKRVSLIPITSCTGVDLSGVLWELNEATLEPAGFISVSNEGTGDVAASFRTGTCVLFILSPTEESPTW